MKSWARVCSKQALVNSIHAEVSVPTLPSTCVESAESGLRDKTMDTIRNTKHRTGKSPGDSQKVQQKGSGQTSSVPIEDFNIGTQRHDYKTAITEQLYNL